MGPLHLLNKIQDNFLVMNGDILTDMNYNIFLKFHIKNKNLFSVATYKKNYKIDFGVLKTENQILKDFFEKPKKNLRLAWVSML